MTPGTDDLQPVALTEGVTVPSPSVVYVLHLDFGKAHRGGTEPTFSTGKKMQPKSSGFLPVSIASNFNHR
jgi:hypothetical protein